jgi:hypothetical protein
MNSPRSGPDDGFAFPCLYDARDTTLLLLLPTSELGRLSTDGSERAAWCAGLLCSTSRPASNTIWDEEAMLIWGGAECLPLTAWQHLRRLVASANAAAML